MHLCLRQSRVRIRQKLSDIFKILGKIKIKIRFIGDFCWGSRCIRRVICDRRFEYLLMAKEILVHHYLLWQYEVYIFRSYKYLSRTLRWQSQRRSRTDSENCCLFACDYAGNERTRARTKVLHAWYEIQSSPRARRQKTSSFSAAARDVGLNEDFNAVPHD